MHNGELNHERLRLLRMSLGMKGVDLAEKIGVSPSFLSMLESGKRKTPNSYTLYRLADALGTSMEYLVSARDDEKAEKVKRGVYRLMRLERDRQLVVLSVIESLTEEEN